MNISVSPYTYKATLKVVFIAINQNDPSPVNFDLPFNQSQTAFDILLKAQKHPCYNFEDKTNPIYGKFVTSICGVQNNKTSSQYWVFYVNNKEASVGVSFYRIKPNDVVEFRYMNKDTSVYIRTNSVTLKVIFDAINKKNPDPVYMDYPSNENKTAFDILRAAQSHPCFNFNYTVNPPHGAYITSICGISQNSTAHYYWIFYVNNKEASVGVSTYLIKPNDVLEMRYMHQNVNKVIRTYNVTLKVEFDVIDKQDPAPLHLNFPVNVNKTAFDVLLVARSLPCYNFKYARDPKYGVFITSICGVSNDNTLHNYWMFYVNDEKASVGVSSYEISPSDTIQMRYLAMDLNLDIRTYIVSLKVMFSLPDKTDPEPFYINYPINENKTAFDVLLAAQSHPCYNFSYTEIPVYGAFITSICGVNNSISTHTYWLFYVNGKEQSLGISSYIVKRNDVVELRYLNSNTLLLRYNIAVRVVFEAIDRRGFAPVQLSFPRKESKTVFDILLEAHSYNCYNSSHSVLANSGGSITSICGIHENKTAEIFWKLFINGNEISDDVRSYGVKPNDIVEMRYVSVAVKSTPAPSGALFSVNKLNHILLVFICSVVSVLSVFHNQFYD